MSSDGAVEGTNPKLADDELKPGTDRLEGCRAERHLHAHLTIRRHRACNAQAGHVQAVHVQVVYMPEVGYMCKKRMSPVRLFLSSTAHATSATHLHAHLTIRRHHACNVQAVHVQAVHVQAVHVQVVQHTCMYTSPFADTDPTTCHQQCIIITVKAAT